MLILYILWFLGSVFGILAFAELIVVLYKISNKKGSMKINSILAIIFIIVSIGCISSAVMYGVSKILSSEKINYSEIGQNIGEASSDVTANAYKSFKKNWNKIVESKDSE